MMLPFQVLAAWLLADLITGVFHWFDDLYLDGKHSLELVNSIANENKLHHDKPTAMLASSGWTNMRTDALVAWPLAFGLWAFGFPLVVWLACFFAGFGNLVHRWAHMPPRQLPRWIRGLQHSGLFISKPHHDSHHMSMEGLIPKHLAGWKFCPMTAWVNPVVDRIKLWRAMELALQCVGLKPARKRMEDSNSRGSRLF